MISIRLRHPKDSKDEASHDRNYPGSDEDGDNEFGSRTSVVAFGVT